MSEVHPLARQELDQHLVAITGVLRSDGRDEDEVLTVVAAVEEQVLEIATSLQRGDASNMRGLLRTLDPPSDYAEAPRTAVPSSGLGRLAMWLAVGGPFFGIGAGAVAGLLGSDGSAFGSLVILVAAGLGVAVGIAAREHAQGRVAAVISALVFGGYWAMLFIVDAVVGS